MKKLLAAFLLFPLLAFGAAPYGTRVIDGDTIQVPSAAVEGLPTMISVRLYGINTPESTSAAKCPAERQAGEATKLYVRDRLAKADTVKIVYKKWDKYGGRFDGFVIIDGQDLAQDLIKNGYGVPYLTGKRPNPWCNPK